jgi:hypothetical protein
MGNLNLKVEIRPIPSLSQEKCTLINTRGAASKLNGSPAFGKLSPNGELMGCNQAYSVGAEEEAVNCNLRYLATLFGNRGSLSFRCQRNPLPKPTSSPKS